MEKVFGLSPFRFRNKRIRALSLSSRVIIIFFIILYPVSCIKVLDFFRSNDSEVTLYARNLTFAFNWLLLAFIFGNEALSVDYSGFSEMERMLRELIKRQNFNDNLTLLMRCTLKGTLIFSGLFSMKLKVYSIHTNRNLMTWEKALVPLLYLPFVILTLTSNRIYVANCIVRQWLTKSASEFKSTQLQMKEYSIIRSHLHDFFMKFNKLNAINLLTVMCFCMLNIVYQVIKSSTFTIQSFDFVHFQAFFLYLHISSSFLSNRPFIFGIVRVSLASIFLYTIELIFTIQIYDDIKNASDASSIRNELECNSSNDGNDFKVIHEFESMMKIFILEMDRGSTARSVKNFC